MCVCVCVKSNVIIIIVILYIIKNWIKLKKIYIYIEREINSTAKNFIFFNAISYSL